RRATTFPKSSSGRAQGTSGGRTRSTSAPTGSTKLIDVATQVQYFVVALTRRDEVTAKAASATRLAKARWISRARITTGSVGSSDIIPSLGFVYGVRRRRLQTERRPAAPSGPSA